jgi:Ca2+/H+ antiporter, TMEM165/GDT1 family
MKNRSCLKFCLLIPLAVLAFLAVFTFAVHGLWNCVLTDVLAVKAISYWQALGILVLAKILFGGFPHRCCSPCGHFRERMMSKRWESATPEQREQMRDEMRRRFGDWPHAPWCCSDDKASEGPGKATDA